MLRSCSMRNGDILEMNLVGATLISTYFHRIAPRNLEGLEQAKITMGGVTNQEVLITEGR